MIGDGSYLKFEVVALAILLTMAMAAARAVVGPSTFDRILAANAFGTKTVLLIAVVGFMTGRPHFLDLSLVYALINFIGVIAMLKFVRKAGYDGPKTD